ncbi:beta-1,3-galactosyltransferase 1-like isoform X2 [Bacillus rossius redtenbacheri]|uniref:beta-1,3-galactosyltransferase 1-like isoform X2 n=1 Tax=Bacillus rossius redtenbacheri TaxID=93214 RepID=UPI002FDDC69C
METIGLLYEARPTRHTLSAHDINHRRYLRCFAACFACLCLCVLLYVPVYNQARARRTDARSVDIAGWSRNTSRDLRLYVRPDNETALVAQPEICAGDLFLLIVVCSAVPNWEARAAIRDTWGGAASSNASSAVRVAFLLGDPDNATLQDQVEEESLQFGDIIQEGFIDSYNNLTVKSVMLLKWVVRRCRSLRYVMKTDDDMFVNVGGLTGLLRSRGPSAPLLLGTLICGARPISDPRSKWFAPLYMFSGRVYPNYLSGTGYVMSTGIAALLYRAALGTPLFHLEDVYVTGLCARAAGVRPRDHPGFTYARRRLDPCLYRHPSVVTSHRLTPAELRRVWALVRAPDLDCSVFALPTTSRPGAAHATPAPRRQVLLSAPLDCDCHTLTHSS